MVLNQRRIASKSSDTATDGSRYKYVIMNCDLRNCMKLYTNKLYQTNKLRNFIFWYQLHELPSMVCVCVYFYPRIYKNLILDRNFDIIFQTSGSLFCTYDVTLIIITFIPSCSGVTSLELRNQVLLTSRKIVTLCLVTAFGPRVSEIIVLWKMASANSQSEANLLNSS